MASPRKRYFRVADQVLREGWPDDVLATAVRLMAYLNGRWARDGVADDAAGDALLTPADVLAVAGLASARRARERVLSLPRTASLTSLEVEEVRRGRVTFVRVSWPKFATFQDFGSRSRGDHRANDRRPGDGDWRPATGQAQGGGEPPPRPRPASRAPRPASRSGEDGPSGRAPSRTRTDPVTWARMFESAAAERGVDALAWVSELLPRAELMATGEPGTPAWNEKVKSNLWTFWKAPWRDDRARLEREQKDRASTSSARDGGGSLVDVASLLNADRPRSIR